MTSNKDEDKNNSQGNSKSTSDKVSSQIDNIALRPLCEFWEEVRGDRLLPEASEIDPAQIAYILKDIAILDVIDEMTIRYRLAGTAISERTGNDPTGGNLIDMVAPDKRQLVSQIMNTIIAHPVGTIATYEDVYQSGKRALVESLYLPLQKVDDSVGRIVSVHLWKETLTYEQEQPEPVVAAKIRSIQWLDIGAGTPEDSPY